ncbi:carbohydrate-binding family 9-like protein [Leptobacterium flavescens]|uniref:Carbohydrate-binding family 9-like protein n=1 Tax=Leptobacterium flavescens TaxID=472055 RepID=A0A6P0UKC8_9FLAO|nr:carbohydrate-binding family 9-like protein [Leptobacterium flavescens]NER12338.1 carbohydrate-binding family 9-like protein [Leptobacterium flavescens]
MSQYPKYFIFLFSLISCVAVYAQEAINVRLESGKDIVSPKTYVIHKTSGSITIDGKADEKDWINTPYTDAFIDIEGHKKPKYDTRVKMLWSDTYLYVYAKLTEDHIWGTLKKRDTVIFYNNDFEVFIDPSNDTHDYGEIEINALGTVWDLLLNKPYRSGAKPNTHWNLNDLKTAVYLDGTLNDPSDTDNFWAVEMAIPLRAFAELKNRPRTIPKDGEQWRINFSRVHWDFDLNKNRYSRKKVNDKYAPEYNWVWSNQGVINMHEPEKWGYVQFSDKLPNEKVVFQQKDPVHLRQVSYALYRKVSRGSLKELLKNKTGYTTEIIPVTEGNKTYKATFIKTYSGFNLMVTEIQKNISCIIREDGYSKIIK